MISIKEFIPVYSQVKPFQKQALKEFLKIKNLASYFESDVLTQEKLDKVKEFVENQRWSSVGLPVENDNEQKIKYLNGLNNLINSKEFQLYRAERKASVINEQINIYKDIKHAIK